MLRRRLAMLGAFEAPVLLSFASLGAAERLAPLALARRRRGVGRPQPPGIGRRLIVSTGGLLAASAQAEDLIDGNQDGIVDKMEFIEATRFGLDHDGEHSKSFRRRVFEDAERLYEFADMDGDGILSKTELAYSEYLAQTALDRLLGQMPQDIVEDSSPLKWLRRIDTQGDGRVDEEHFWAAARQDMVGLLSFGELDFDEEMIRAQAFEIFQQADINDDGVLSPRELHYAGFLVFSYVSWSLTMATMAALDVNSDGRTDVRELAESLLLLVRKPGSSKTFQEHVLDEFETADTDGDKALTAPEMARLANDFLRMTPERDRVLTAQPAASAAWVGNDTA